MQDIEILLENKPGTLALMGETLGKNKISFEGGGVFQNGDVSIAHFLVEEAERAKEELSSPSILTDALSSGFKVFFCSIGVERDNCICVGP